MEKKWIYFGVFLDSISKAKNLSALETNGVVIPKDSSACIEIPSLNTNHDKHHENANYEVRAIK